MSLTFYAESAKSLLVAPEQDCVLKAMSAQEAIQGGGEESGQTSYITPETYHSGILGAAMGMPPPFTYPLPAKPVGVMPQTRFLFMLNRTSS